MRRSSLVNLGAADSPLHSSQHLLYTATVPVAPRGLRNYQGTE